MLNKGFILGVLFTLVLLVGVFAGVGIASYTWDGKDLVVDGPYDFTLTALQKVFLQNRYPMVNKIMDTQSKTYFTINITEQNKDLNKAEEFYKVVEHLRPRYNVDGTIDDCSPQFIASLNKRVMVCTLR